MSQNETTNKHQSLPNYLRDFTELHIGLAALFRRLHSQLVVVQEGPINS